MMKLTIQTGNIQEFRESLVGESPSVRYGAEFCMYALPPFSSLETAFNEAKDAGKELVYVTPRLAEGYMETIREHLEKLNELGELTIVANDLGTVGVLREFDNLRLHLGRQLVYTPSRCPWNEITEHPVSIFAKRKIKQIFYQTALNYQPTVDFYKELGAIGADVDWIPDLFPAFSFLIKNKLNLSVHLHSVPVAITRKCHMARFLDEPDLDRCSRPCYDKAYSMVNETLKTDMVLHGNTVFKLDKPSVRLSQRLAKQGVNELVYTASPLTNYNPEARFDEIIQNLRV